jgi:hypothetical protein
MDFIINENDCYPKLAVILGFQISLSRNQIFVTLCHSKSDEHQIQDKSYQNII